jgi:hypothetical protein
MDILYVNFDVGSAIEFAGNIFEEWIKELIVDNDINLNVIKTQNPYWMLSDIFYESKPNIIILNEFFDRSNIPSFFYKKYFPETSIILIEHVWQRMKDCFDKNEYNINKTFYQECTQIFCINNFPENFVLNIKNLLNFYYPTDPKVFNIFKPWGEREKNFIYLGNILPHKLSYEFIEKIKGTDIKIDCYGKKMLDNEELKPYYELFDSRSENLIYKGEISQNEVPKMINDYKYFIMPHNGFEPFNWVLLQSIFCGTIPLIVNNKMQNDFDPSWIDWADTLYFGCDKVDELINNLNLILIDSPNLSKISEDINNRGQEKFNYYKFKDKFQEVVSTEIEICKLYDEIRKD